MKTPGLTKQPIVVFLSPAKAVQQCNVWPLCERPSYLNRARSWSTIRSSSKSAFSTTSPRPGTTVRRGTWRYSHIYHEDGNPYLLTITLSIRNTSVDHDIVVKSVRYFDTQGTEVKSYLQKPRRLAALATVEFLIERDDTTGGSGANFLVEWVADQALLDQIDCSIIALKPAGFVSPLQVV